MTYRSAKRDITMWLTGDTMLSRRLTPFDEPDYLALVEQVRDADLAFTNLESCVREPHEGAANPTVGTPMTTPPALLADLSWMGFDVVSCANNHAADYGAGGVTAMTAHLRRAEIPFAGAGANLAQARAPAYADTAAGRVALVAATTFFKPGDQAADQRADAQGRAGINPLKYSRFYTVDDEGFAALRGLNERLGLVQDAARHRAQFFSAKEMPKDGGDSLTFLGQLFVRANSLTLQTRVDSADAEANLRQIREAKRQADWVIFSLHSHEFGPSGRLTAKTDAEMEEPAAFAAAFARAAIDAGADVVVGHGPHLTLGVEVYKDRPILFSLGNFIFQNDTVETIPAESYARFGLGAEATPADFFDARTGNGVRGFPATEEYWEGLAASCEFKAGKLAALRLHPLDLGFGASRAERGRPLLARGAKAKRILERVQLLSKRFNTELGIDGETGIVRL